MTLVSPLALQDSLIVEDFHDEILIDDLKSHQPHCLNKNAARVWKLSDRQMSRRQTVRLYVPMEEQANHIQGGHE